MTEPDYKRRKISTVRFFSTTNKNKELSNFYQHDVHLNYLCRWFMSSEHLYQCLKFMQPEAPVVNVEMVDFIRLQKTPYKAKIAANGKPSKYNWQQTIVEERKTFIDKGVIFDPEWDDHRIDAMRICLNVKFDQDKHCRDVLVQTGDSLLEENSPFDSFWGIGKNKDGENNLGKLLMEKRQAIVEQNKQPEKK
jgi:ribA/ribD-fused uncharacterized protein